MEKILILDFGSQYTQLIARRVRELNVYCEIHPFNKIPAIDASVRGVILSGSPSSVRDAQAPIPDLSAIKGRLPLLTLADLICPARADHYKALPLYPVLDAQLHLVWTSAVYASPLCRAFVQQVKMELTCGLQSQ